MLIWCPLSYPFRSLEKLYNMEIRKKIFYFYCNFLKFMEFYCISWEHHFCSFLTIYLFIYPSIHIYLFIYLSIHSFSHVFLSTNVNHYISIYLSIYPAIKNLNLFLTINMAIYWTTYPFYLFIYDTVGSKFFVYKIIKTNSIIVKSLPKFLFITKTGRIYKTRMTTSIKAEPSYKLIMIAKLSVLLHL